MISKLRLFALVFLALFSSGCIYQMKKDAYDSALGNAISAGEKARADYNDKAKLLQEVRRRSSTPDARPYPDLAADLGKMSAGLGPMEAGCQVLKADRQKFDKLCDGRPDLSSDRADTWAAFQPVYQESKVTLAGLQEKCNAYADTSNHFVSLCNQNGINRIDAKQVRGQLAGNLGQLDKAVAQMRGAIADARSRLKAHTQQTLGLASHRQAQDVLSSMDLLAGRIEEKAKAIKGRAGAFEASLKGSDTLWIGPGLPKVEVVELVSQDLVEVSKLVGEMNQKSQEFNSMDK